MEEKKRIEFYGGGWVSFLPFLIFLTVTLYISFLKAPDVRGMWIGALAGIMFTYFLAKDKETYAKVVIDGMADPIAIVPVACWIFAGAFAAVLRSSKLVEGIIWAAYHLGAKGTFFVIVTFLACCIFSTATGTGFGTIVAGMSVLYPAGVFLGANPLALIGAIVGGGAFGDNLAPVSDTTICSAASQGADVGGVVMTRLKYCLAAGVTTLVLLVLFGGGGSVSSVPYETLAAYMNPKGLIMLIPAALTIYVAVKKGDIIIATTIGTVAAAAFAILFGLADVNTLFFVKDGAVGGALVNGVAGMVDICILALLVLSCVHIMQAGGGDRKLLELAGVFVKTVRGVEASIVFLVIAMSTIMGLNAPPILAVGTSFAKPIGEKYNIHPYRRANLLDATACTLVYSMPWTPALLLTQSLAKEANKTFGGMVPVFNTVQMTPWIIYCWILLAVMIFAVVTGWGREYIGEDGRPVYYNRGSWAAN
ncbi:Na+/H+ antiporter NhaC family protein [Thermosediminibacter litoriperuensis]|uniref:Transporter (NhaC family) n=1 Tax=Thermosediminibacter litoriperuensis TaxID=291989 RepID=A0A5S5AQN1_9FIRM|nr:Na+/H+ antiporter NhaC family protein [Thermosediminibacter litoriperuensis]TYP53791.1 transporter (NhaC family) [Thermosediminibacter litoriperuensis]